MRRAWTYCSAIAVVASVGLGPALADTVFPDSTDVAPTDNLVTT